MRSRFISGALALGYTVTATAYKKQDDHDNSENGVKLNKQSLKEMIEKHYLVREAKLKEKGYYNFNL